MHSISKHKQISCKLFMQIYSNTHTHNNTDYSSIWPSFLHSELCTLLECLKETLKLWNLHRQLLTTKQNTHAPHAHTHTHAHNAFESSQTTNASHATCWSLWSITAYSLNNNTPATKDVYVIIIFLSFIITFHPYHSLCLYIHCFKFISIAFVDWRWDGKGKGWGYQEGNGKQTAGNLHQEKEGAYKESQGVVHSLWGSSGSFGLLSFWKA